MAKTNRDLPKKWEREAVLPLGSQKGSRAKKQTATTHLPSRPLTPEGELPRAGDCFDNDFCKGVILLFRPLKAIGKNV